MLNLFFGQRHIQSPGPQVRMDHGEWRDQHLPSAKPAASVYHEVANDPRVIIEVELIYRSKLAIRRADH
jgi:hypothetical protein